MERRRWVAISAIAAVVAASAAIAGTGVISGAHDGARSTSTGRTNSRVRSVSDPPGAVPARFVGGPSGGAPNVDLRPDRGMFATECQYSHSSNDDPIVFPGAQGKAHHHDFFGNSTTDFTSTIESLSGASTTCRQREDSAAYWAPALSRYGAYIEPISADAYYRVASGVDPAAVEAYPQGLMMIAGDAHSMVPEPTAVVAWACDRSRKVSSMPHECPEGAELTVRVTFPDCWNGRDTDSEDHKAHMAYSGAEGCPSTHPVPVPMLTIVVHYPVTGSVEGLGLSPGSLMNGHADFVNTWNEKALQREVDHCLHRGLVCSSPGGTGGSPPLF